MARIPDLPRLSVERPAPFAVRVTEEITLASLKNGDVIRLYEGWREVRHVTHEADTVTYRVKGSGKARFASPSTPATRSLGHVHRNPVSESIDVAEIRRVMGL